MENLKYPLLTHSTMLIKMIIDKIKDLESALILLDEKLGFKKFKRYVFLVVFVVALFNINSIATGLVGFVLDIVEEIHKQKMMMRDEYMTELVPTLAELRASVDADRVLYFEFHNSEENIEGLPFKFFDLIKSCPRYGVPEIPGDVYKNINSGMYTELFDEIKIGKILYCKGFHDHEFRKEFRGVFELINEKDRSKQQIFFSVPGIKTPIGFVILEWLDDDKEFDIQKEIQPKVHEHVARLALISTRLR